MDVKALMAQAVRYNRDRTAIIHGQRQITFAEAWDRGVRLANALIGLGLRPGDRVASLEDNCIEAADLIQASAIANLVRVPLYARNAKEAHKHMIANTQCRAVVVSSKYAHEIEEIRRDIPTVERVIVRDESYESWLSTQSDVDPGLDANPEHYFVIRHTGGTTGQPKGVAYTHKSWIAACRDWFYIFPQVLPGDRCLHIGPISHGSGYQYLPVWLAGGCNVLLDHFDVAQALDLIESERVAYCQMAPPMLRAIIDYPGSDKRDYSSLKCILVGAAPIHPTTAQAARALFGDVLYQGYGQTEVLPIAFMGPAEWFSDVEGSEPLKACGRVMPFSQVAIWDEANNPVRTGEIGEIVAKADGQMSAFWSDRDAVSERIVDGWIKTGDIGRIDHNGYVYLIDRASDIIISGGYNIWPLDIERVLDAHPEILEVAVFGVPHPKWGETPLALCVVRPGHKVTEADLILRVANELGSYMKPSKIVFQFEPLQRSAVGKVNRKKLREPYWSGVERRISGS